MTTTPEMTLLNYFEIHGHRESARILRAIVDKQRQAEVDALPLITRTYEFDPKDYATPHSDTDAHPENQGSDLFAANAGITPEQARYAYDSALEPPTQAIPCDSRPKPWFAKDWRGVKLMLWHEGGRLRSADMPKHRFITLSGASRQEPCCR